MTRIKTGGMKKGYTYTKKRFWVNNGNQESLMFEGDLIPDGWERGRLKTGKCWSSGKTKYTNSSLAKMSQTKSSCSDVYCGTRTDYLKDNLCNDRFLNYWEKHTCTECVQYFHISWEDLHIIIDILGLESPIQHKHKLKDYIFDEDFKQRQSNILKGKNTWSKGSTRSRDSIEKWKQIYHSRTSEQLKEQKLKEYNTRKLNGTLGYHKTHDEEQLESLLIQKFGKDNVVYNYFDAVRYPFKCDFYIKSEDLFIELNAGWEHQNKPFEGTEEDKINLERLKEKSKTSDYYSNVIYQWTDLDVRKRTVASENNLNYIVPYTLEEAYELIENY